MAPFTPFFTESMYQNLRRALPPGEPASVHFCDIPEGSPPLEADRHLHEVSACAADPSKRGRAKRGQTAAWAAIPCVGVRTAVFSPICGLWATCVARLP
jgi:isoleucyl-tRNA synthetase